MVLRLETFYFFFAGVLLAGVSDSTIFTQSRMIYLFSKFLNNENKLGNMKNINHDDIHSTAYKFFIKNIFKHKTDFPELTKNGNHRKTINYHSSRVYNKNH